VDSPPGYRDVIHDVLCSIFSTLLSISIASVRCVVTDLSPRPFVGLCLCVSRSVWKVYCGKTADIEGVYERRPKTLCPHHLNTLQEAQLNARGGRPYFPINLILTLSPSLIDF